MSTYQTRPNDPGQLRRLDRGPHSITRPPNHAGRAKSPRRPQPPRRLDPSELAALDDARWRALDARAAQTAARAAQQRVAYGALLAELVAQHAGPVSLVCPSSACMLCGIAAVELDAAVVTRYGGTEAAVSAVWRTRRVSPAALGGRSGPERLSGHVCPSCRQAVEAIGSIGASAMTRALLEHLSSVGRASDVRRLRERAGPDGVLGLTGWGVLADAARQAGSQLAANTEPWGHLSLG